MGIFVRVMGSWIAPDDDFVARDTEIYANVEQVTLLAARMLTLDDDPAGDDPVEEAFEFLGASAYACRNRLRAVHVPKRDLKRDLHPTLLSAGSLIRAPRRCLELIEAAGIEIHQPILRRIDPDHPEIGGRSN
jgi:hypothetical protein